MILRKMSWLNDIFAKYCLFLSSFGVIGSYESNWVGRQRWNGGDLFSLHFCPCIPFASKLIISEW